MTVLVPTRSNLVSSGNALDLASNVDLIVNDGIMFISGDTDNFGDGILAGGSNDITVKGQIAGSQALKMEGSGKIAVGSTGRLYGVSCGISLDAPDVSVVNYGIVTGGAGIVSVGGATVANSGSIIGDHFGLYVGSESTFEINNTGLVESRDGTYSFVSVESCRDTIRNSGDMIGDVLLGDGNDTYDGRNGRLNGTVHGGDGYDKLYNGKDGGVISGDRGHDTLYGNTGNDTFAFASHTAADYDTIHSFDVNHDKIQLAAIDFDGLVAGKTATFVVGTKATTATDHLFYNASTGYLFYDQDGSGTADRPELIARMDKSLALTASDFKVV